MTFLPITTTLPNRKPFVRCPSFVDGKGPPPVEFFDESQDHLRAYFHGALGWEWSINREDFDSPVYPANYLGDFRYVNAGFGVTLSVLPSLDFQGEHAVWRGIAGVLPYEFTMQTNGCYVGTGDLLLSCKVLCLNKQDIDTVGLKGFWVGCGDPAGGYPAFAGGSDFDNWQVFMPPAIGEPPALFDTGIPFYDSQNTMPDQVMRAWHVLQISRNAGVWRYFVNGKLARLTGNGLTNAEGIYYPQSLTEARRYFKIRRWAGGLGTSGFYIDRYDAAFQRV
jgi:hypothetical protein